MADTTTQSKIPTLGRRGGGWVGIQLLLIGALVAAGVRGRGDITDGLLVVAVTLGTTLVGIGAIIVLLAIRQLDRSLSAMPKPVDAGVLVEDGVYAYVRHPIYLGLMLVSFGWSAAMDSFAALVVAFVFTAFLDLKSRREEAWLREQYPEYVMYATRVRRFVPYVY